MVSSYIVDYGVGNIGSLQNMYRRVTGTVPQLIQNVDCVQPGDRVMLPGVGNFGFAMKRLNDLSLTDGLRQLAASKEVAILGICLGAQLLLEGSEEADEPGLGIIPGRCRKFDSYTLPDNLRIPHMGWAEVNYRNATHPLATDHNEKTRFYFVHSFRMMPKLKEHELFTARHGYEFCAGVCSDYVVGVQFHPEKSHRFGMQFLKSFSNWRKQ